MERAMKRISSKEARENMSDIINDVSFKGNHYVLTRNGKGMAVIISLEEWKVVEQILQNLEDQEDIQDADKAMDRINKGGKTISHKEMKKILEL